MSWWIVFLIGMAGALAPEILRLYSLRNDPVPTFPLFYIVISVLFACLGGFVAVLLPATTPVAAFYAGISTPTLISTALRKGSELRRPVLRNARASGPPARGFRRFIAAL